MEEGHAAVGKRRSGAKHISSIREDLLTFVIVVLEIGVDGPDEVEKLRT